MNPDSQLDTLRAQVGQGARIHDTIDTVVDSRALATSAGHLQIRSGTTVQEMERALIMETLRATGDNRTEAAKLLGISIRTLRNKLHEYRGEALPDTDS
jgi:DNA-binding NtrC family response regulator